MPPARALSLSSLSRFQADFCPVDRCTPFPNTPTTHTHTHAHTHLHACLVSMACGLRLSLDSAVLRVSGMCRGFSVSTLRPSSCAVCVRLHHVHGHTIVWCTGWGKCGLALPCPPALLPIGLVAPRSAVGVRRAAVKLPSGGGSVASGRDAVASARSSSGGGASELPRCRDHSGSVSARLVVVAVTVQHVCVRVCVRACVCVRVRVCVHRFVAQVEHGPIT
jgi:hypothetical protein